jgi:hypothetical protein
MLILYKRLLLLVACLFLFFTFFVGIVRAQNSYGDSALTLSAYNVAINPASSTVIKYAITLSSGNAAGTQLEVTDIRSNSSVSGISFGGLPSLLENPTFSGNFSILVSNSTALGIYLIDFRAVGADPSTNVATLVLNVTNKTITTALTGKSNGSGYYPPPTPTGESPAFLGNAFPSGPNEKYGILGIIIIIVAFLAAFTAHFYGLIRRYIPKIAFVLVILAGLYLLIFDPNLMTYGTLHYDLLVVYIATNVFFAYLVFDNRRIEALRFITFIVPSLFLVGLLIDLFGNLPFSYFYSSTVNASWPYLFGFGFAAYSSFGVSLAFTILLISSEFLCLHYAFDFFKSRTTALQKQTRNKVRL